VAHEHNESGSDTATLTVSTSSTRTMSQRTGRTRQMDELYDLYDLLMIERLLKRHPSLKQFTGV